MKLTQGAFSFLPDLTDEQITKQIQYALNKSWAVSIEFTDDPHPRNSYWEMWGLPLFDIKDPAAVLFEINMARKAKVTYASIRKSISASCFEIGLLCGLRHGFEEASNGMWQRATNYNIPRDNLAITQKSH
jgi:hypothetical protein